MAKVVGLRTEILTTLTLLMAAALLLGGFLMLRLTEQSLLKQRLSQLNSVTQVIGTALNENNPQALPLANLSFPTELLKRLPDEMQNSGWWLFDQDLHLLSSFRSGVERPFDLARLRQIMLSQEPFQTVEFPSLLNSFTTTSTQSKIVLPLIKGNRFYGLLEIHFSLDDIWYRLLKTRRYVLLYVLLYGTVLVVIGYYLLQRNVVKPARNLLLATEEVGRGSLETRLPVAGPLEISLLAEAYNNMVDALKGSRRETQAHIEALERTNNDLKVSREELIRSEKLASVGQLAAGLAHELGNPLAALIGYLEIMKDRIEDNSSRDILQRSLVETERIDFLVRELLNFSRPSDNMPERFDPAVEVTDCLNLLKSQGVFGPRQIEVSLGESLPFVKMGRQRFQQIFINLLLNAVQATEASGQITLTGEAGEKFVCLEIMDNGCGISAEDRSRIFDPFFTTKAPGCGTGLGLSICHRLIEEVGGMIEVYSEPGKGSRFKVLLPASDIT
ncbi:sensor histidine kinase [Geopsychrobacter electrodiphilus]|uniref:sensor histidine kinase n=1 Tax=Geopsychrobacter electrodiphilus TaxID=225196 RepID=UPI00035E8032|nr:ATP-binding protein [Geopsychrobacter electrodiphilus]